MISFADGCRCLFKGKSGTWMKNEGFEKDGRLCFCKLKEDS